MTRPDPSAFDLPGGPTGVLLIHGFTGSPPEMRLVADYLHARGLTVAAPLLPGHGTTPADLNTRTAADLNTRTAADWTSHVSRALADLQTRCPTVFVGGLSLGALLALYLAADQGALAGAVLYSPAIMPADRRAHLLPLARYLLREMPKPPDDFADPAGLARLNCYDVYPVVAAAEVTRLVGQVKRRLPQVRCPLMIIYSTADRAVRPEGARLIYDRVGSRDKEMVALHDSGHVITADREWETVAERTYQFIRRHSPPA